MNNYKDCNQFSPNTEMINGFKTGTCGHEPFQINDFENDHSMGVVCGHDGEITIGEMFGCVNFEDEPYKDIQVYCQECFKKEATMRQGVHETSVCGDCYTKLEEQPMSFL